MASVKPTPETTESAMPTPDQPRPDAAVMPTVQDVIAKAVWDFDREDHEIDPNVRAHALSIRIQEALAEAGLVIVPVHSCPHCGVEWTTTVLVDAAVRCPNCYQPDERWTVTLAARQGEGQGQ